MARPATYIALIQVLNHPGGAAGVAQQLEEIDMMIKQAGGTCECYHAFGQYDLVIIAHGLSEADFGKGLMAARMRAGGSVSVQTLVAYDEGQARPIMKSL